MPLEKSQMAVLFGLQAEHFQREISPALAQLKEIAEVKEEFEPIYKELSEAIELHLKDLMAMVSIPLITSKSTSDALVKFFPENARLLHEILGIEHKEKTT